MEMQFGEFAAMIERELAYRMSLERQLKKVERERDQWREMADPGWRQRDLREALVGELRLRQ